MLKAVIYQTIPFTIYLYGYYQCYRYYNRNRDRQGENITIIFDVDQELVLNKVKTHIINQRPPLENILYTFSTVTTGIHLVNTSNDMKKYQNVLAHNNCVYYTLYSYDKNRYKSKSKFNKYKFNYKKPFYNKVDDDTLMYYLTSNLRNNDVVIFQKNDKELADKFNKWLKERHCDVIRW